MSPSFKFLSEVYFALIVLNFNEMHECNKNPQIRHQEDK